MGSQRIRELEAALNLALRESAGLPSEERLAFISRHLHAQGNGSETPAAQFESDNLKTFRSGLPALKRILSNAINEARGQQGWPILAVASSIERISSRHLSHVPPPLQIEPDILPAAPLPAAQLHLGISMDGLWQLVRSVSGTEVSYGAESSCEPVSTNAVQKPQFPANSATKQPPNSPPRPTQRANPQATPRTTPRSTPRSTPQSTPRSTPRSMAGSTVKGTNRSTNATARARQITQRPSNMKPSRKPISSAAPEEYAAASTASYDKQKRALSQLNGHNLYQYLLERSLADGLSECERIAEQGCSDDDSQPATGNATVFVIWHSGMSLGTLCSSLEHFVMRNGLSRRDTFFWLSDVSLRLADATLDIGDSLTRTRALIGKIRYSLLVLETWRAPPVLSRGWALWELYCTAQCGAHFHLAMDKKLELELCDTLKEDYSLLMDSCQPLIAFSTASTREDATIEALHACIKDEGADHDAIDMQVSTIVGNAFVAQCISLMESLPVEEKVVADSVMDSVGMLLYERGELHGALEVLREALRLRRDHFGSVHRVTLASMANLGSLLLLAEDTHGSQEVLMEAVEGVQPSMLLRPVPAKTLEHVFVGVSSFLDRKGQTKESIGGAASLALATLEALLRIEEGTRASNRGDHNFRDLFNESCFGVVRSILAQSHQLSLYLQVDSESKAAASLLQALVLACRKLLGNEHSNTLVAIHNLGTLLKDEGNLAEAAVLLREVVDTGRKILGANHPSILTASHNLGLILRVEGRLEDAMTMIRDAVVGSREARGDKDAQTIASALCLEKLLSQLQARLGPNHPDIMASKEALDGLKLEEIPEEDTAAAEQDGAMAVTLRQPAGNLRNGATQYASNTDSLKLNVINLPTAQTDWGGHTVGSKEHEANEKSQEPVTSSEPDETVVALNEVDHNGEEEAGDAGASASWTDFFRLATPLWLNFVKPPQ